MSQQECTCDIRAGGCTCGVMERERAAQSLAAPKPDFVQTMVKDGTKASGGPDMIYMNVHGETEWKPVAELTQEQNIVDAPTTAFRPGDVVQLKSGGPRMTVTGTDMQQDVMFVGLVWFDGGVSCHNSLRSECLVQVPVDVAQPFDAYAYGYVPKSEVAKLIPPRRDFPG